MLIRSWSGSKVAGSDTPGLSIINDGLTILTMRPIRGPMGDRLSYPPAIEGGKHARMPSSATALSF
jgi:hypothetical protein